ncbi:hypothetical protein [Streptomyces sp. NBC_00083]|uniref:SCO2584 family spore wall biosynthesis protein n=1 Tax=Streptomyces sp. NBC_00083 TaxID=2975647 RepID=UPI0022575DAB|nr:hypothetical protein [Streptomyces sp. NBC_00083]MCX5382472.1 hypothetical protein [Streptomyces sp. NBC_00083]
MPDDAGGGPFPDGWEPDDDRGGADDDFASVVFDEDFVRAAAIHEPTAVERLLAAAQARADAEAARARAGGGATDDESYDDGYDPYRSGRNPDDLGGPGLSGGAEAGPYGRFGGVLRPYRSSARWHRPIAWLMAVIMGIGMVALAFSAVYRGASSDHEDKAPPPATSNVDNPTNAAGPGAAVAPGAGATPIPGGLPAPGAGGLPLPPPAAAPAPASAPVVSGASPAP